MVSIQRARAQITDGWTTYLSEAPLTRICREVGATWRHGALTPVVTIYVFLLQVRHGNPAMTNRPRLSGKSFTPAALAELYRQRWPAVLQRRLLAAGGHRPAGIVGQSAASRPVRTPRPQTPSPGVLPYDQTARHAA